MNRGGNIWACTRNRRLLGGCIHVQYYPAKRYFSERRNQKQLGYIDKWFESIVKPEAFYAKHAEANVRRYFYNVDMQGRLFLEETLPKNIATSIKDEKFLNFFFSRIQRVRDVDREFLTLEGVEKDYAYVSLCGKEVNLIRPAATPIVFHSLSGGDLHFGGTLVQPFDASCLAVSLKTGRLYHKIGVDKKVLRPETPTRDEYGLIRSSVAVTLSEHIHPSDCDGPESTGSGLYFCDEGGSSLINVLPQNSEPGEWALPEN